MVFFLYDFFSKKYRLITSFLNEDKLIAKYEKMKLKNKDKQYIVAINNKNEPCSLAEVIVKNKACKKSMLMAFCPKNNLK